MQICLGQSVAWDEVSGAVTYVVELLNAAAGLVLNTVECAVPSVSALDLFEGSTPGNYNCRVKAVSGSLESGFSTLLPLEYTGLAVPSNLRIE